MQNAGLDEAQAGIKIAGRNTNNLIFADDTTLIAESGEKLKSFLMKVKEESEKADLKLNIPWRRKWQPTPVLLPGESPWTEEPGGASPWARKQSDTTERLNTA